MKWSFVIQQKIKLALLLTGIMVFIILTTLLSRNNIKDIDKSFSSMYQDRLVPAVGIVYLSESLYSKRLLLEKYLLSEAVMAPAEIQKSLRAHDAKIDSLLGDFGKTYLVKEELKSLKAFKNCLSEYALLEQTILHLSEAGNKEAGNAVFDGPGATTFQRAIRRLNELTKIQSVVGQELVKDSHDEASLVNIWSLLQIVVAIVIGLLILSLIHNSKIIDREAQPFHLN